MDSRSKKILGGILFIVGIVLSGLGIFILVSPAQYSATTRIFVEGDISDAGFPINPRLVSENFHPDKFFIATTFEIIKSELVLSNVVLNLNLNLLEHKNYAETIKFVKKHLQLAPVPHTRLLAITFYSNDPNQAAQIANAIADGYLNYRIATREKISKMGMAIMENEFKNKEKEIFILKTNVEELRQRFKTATSSTNQTLEQEYQNAALKLQAAIEANKILGKKIETGKQDSLIRRPGSMVQIIDNAIPPKFPSGPHRFFGVVLTLMGIISLVASFLLFKKVA